MSCIVQTCPVFCFAEQTTFFFWYSLGFLSPIIFLSIYGFIRGSR